MTKDIDNLPQRCFHILTALVGRDLHGAAIGREVSKETGGGLHLWPATLYGSLDELRRAGLVVELIDGDRPEGSSPRERYYRITNKGRALLAKEARRLRVAASRALNRLEQSPGEGKPVVGENSMDREIVDPSTTE